MTVNGDEVRKIKRFKYLRSFIQKNGGFDKDVKHGIRYECIKKREAYSVLCDKRILMRLKGKF